MSKFRQISLEVDFEHKVTLGDLDDVEVFVNATARLAPPDPDVGYDEASLDDVDISICNDDGETITSKINRLDMEAINDRACEMLMEQAEQKSDDSVDDDYEDEED